MNSSHLCAQQAPKLTPEAKQIQARLWYGDAPGIEQIVAPPANTDPVGPIADQMQDVVTNLTAQQTGLPVQTEQHQVLTGLDALIAALEKQRSGNGGGNPNPTKPMARSVLAKGPGGMGPLHDPKAGTRVWGQLPAKDRDQILQSQTEGFPPGYESVLASYYSHLAQPDSASDSDQTATTQPTGQPTDK